MLPEIIQALKDWKKIQNDGVLIGGVALSYYVKPRMTQDLDVLFLNEKTIPNKIPGFKRTREHAFIHNRTHVEVELVTPSLINVPENLVKKVIETAIVDDGIKITSPSGLIALKLNRLKMIDKADIISLINYGNIDLTGFGLSSDLLAQFAALIIEAEKEKK